MNENVFMLKFKVGIIEHQFQNLRNYYKELSLVITSEKTRITEYNEKLQKELENESDEIKGQYSDTYADDWYLSEMLEKTFCYSMVISIYTIIEKYLNEICKDLKGIKNIPLDYDDLDGQGVVRAKKYIEKLGGIEFTTEDSVFLSGINAIRNVIAHDNGELYNMSKTNLGKIMNISQQAPGCQVKQSDVYDVEKRIMVKVYQKIELRLDFVEYCLSQGLIVFRNILRNFLSTGT